MVQTFSKIKNRNQHTPNRFGSLRAPKGVYVGSKTRAKSTQKHFIRTSDIERTTNRKTKAKLLEELKREKGESAFEVVKRMGMAADRQETAKSYNSKRSHQSSKYKNRPPNTYEHNRMPSQS